MKYIYMLLLLGVLVSCSWEPEIITSSLKQTVSEISENVEVAQNKVVITQDEPKNEVNNEITTQLEELSTQEPSYEEEESQIEIIETPIVSVKSSKKAQKTGSSGY